MANRRRPGALRRAVVAGVMGHVPVDAPPAELAEAVRRVDKGERVIDSEPAFAALGSVESPRGRRAPTRARARSARRR